MKERRVESGPEQLLAQKAANIIIGASRQENTSVTRQAAVIALICQRDGMENPTQLKEALLGNDAQIDYVWNTAKAAHAKQDKKNSCDFKRKSNQYH